jgi:CRP-like cAMP-binding protein
MTPLAAFFGTAESRTVAAGEVVFNEGDASDGRMYALLEGEVRIVRGGQTLETVVEGGVFGELALLDDMPRSAAAVAQVDSQLAVISSERFRELILRNPSFALEIMKLLARRIRANLEP